MSPATLVPTFHAEALVVEQDPGTRGQLILALSRRGYGIRTCGTLAEGRQQFDQQRLIVTHANGDTPELRGFVDYVRKTAGGFQPYILAVGEAASPSGLSANRLGLNDFLATPFDEGKLTSHLEAVAQWLNGHGQAHTETATGGLHSTASAEPAPPSPAPPAPAASAASAADPPHAAALLGHYCPILLDQFPQAIAMFDTELRYLVANQRYVREFGLAGHSVIGRSHYELFPDLHETWRQLFDRALAGETGRIDEDLFRRGDGSSDWVRWEVRPWLNEEGETGGVVLTQEVISEQKRAERRQRFTQNLAKSLFESTTLPTLLVALDGRVLRSSPAARQCLGLQPTIDGRLLFWTVYPEPQSEAAEMQRFQSQAPAWVTGEPFAYEPTDIIVPGSPTKLLHWTASPHRGSAGQIEAVLLTGTLVGLPEAAPSSPPPAARAMPAMASPDPEGILSRHLPFGLVVIDRDGHVSYANDPVQSLLGHPFDAAAGFEAWLERGAPEEIQREPILREWRDNVWRRQLSRVFSLATAEGLLKEIELRPQLLSDGRLLLMITDVTEPRRTEDALRTSETKYRSLFHQFPASIALADRAGVIIDANPALEKLTGFTRAELRRLRLHELLTSEPEVGPGSLSALVKTQTGESVQAAVTIGAICNVAGEPVLQAYFIQPQTEPPAVPPPAPAADDTIFEPTPDPAPAAITKEDEAVDAWSDLAFDSLRTPLMVTDLRGRVRAANPAALQFFAYERESLLGGGLYRLFRPDDPSGFSREVSERINLFRCWEGETDFVRADGTTGRCLAEVSPATGSGAPGLLCVVRPIFERVGR